MTDIAIQPLTPANQTDLNRCDNSFTVQAGLTLAATDGRISYTVRPVAPHIKHYTPTSTMPRLTHLHTHRQVQCKVSRSPIVRPGGLTRTARSQGKS